MTTSVRMVAGILFSAALAAATAALSGVPYAESGAEQALLRLSWRARGELVHQCRRPSQEELQRLPPHMRQEQVCEGRVAPFRLELSVDGARVVDDTVYASGARGDRPVYILREVRLAPGTHSVAINFVELLSPDTAAAARAGGAGGTRPAAVFPRSLTFQSQPSFGPGQVILITYDEDARQLIARSEQ